MSIQKSDKKKREGSTAGERSMKMPSLSPLRGANIAGSRFNYILDKEEKAIVAKGSGLSKQEIWAFLE